MKREQLRFVLLRCHILTGDRDFVVVGSQSIHGAFHDVLLPPDTTFSREADVMPLEDRDGDKMWRLSCVAGEETPFEQVYKLAIDGVDRTTSVLPSGWTGRLIPLEATAEDGEVVIGWCLEPHDLAVAKLVAGRDKDYRFVRAAIEASLVSPRLCLERMSHVAVEGPKAGRLEAAREWLSSQVEPARLFLPSRARPPAGRERPTEDMLPVPLDMHADLRDRLDPGGPAAG